MRRHFHRLPQKAREAAFHICPRGGEECRRETFASAQQSGADVASGEGFYLFFGFVFSPPGGGSIASGEGFYLPSRAGVFRLPASNFFCATKKVTKKSALPGAYGWPQEGFNTSNRWRIKLSSLDSELKPPWGLQTPQLSASQPASWANKMLARRLCQALRAPTPLHSKRSGPAKLVTTMTLQC